MISTFLFLGFSTDIHPSDNRKQSKISINGYSNSMTPKIFLAKAEILPVRYPISTRTTTSYSNQQQVVLM
jgi:hypothetical protein